MAAAPLSAHLRVPINAQPLMRAMLRASCFPGAADHLVPINVCQFRPSHEAAEDRMPADIWRMAAR